MGTVQSTRALRKMHWSAVPRASQRLTEDTGGKAKQRGSDGDQILHSIGDFAGYWFKKESPTILLKQCMKNPAFLKAT